jgi:hypothetical protein
MFWFKKKKMISKALEKAKEEEKQKIYSEEQLKKEDKEFMGEAFSLKNLLKPVWYLQRRKEKK